MLLGWMNLGSERTSALCRCPSLLQEAGMKRMCVMLTAAMAAAGWATPSSAQSFGNAMVVSGEQIIVGEPVYEMRSGVVYVFDRDGNGDWVQSQMLEPSDASAANRFGISLATQDDLLLVSATRVDDGTGAVYMYRNDGSTWSVSLFAVDGPLGAFAAGRDAASRARRPGRCRARWWRCSRG